MVQRKETWPRARDACATSGAQLAKPDSRRKNDFIKAKLKGGKLNAVWLGGSRNPRNTNEWLYTDGTKMKFNNWFRGRGN